MKTSNILDRVTDHLPHSVWDQASSLEPKLKEQHSKYIKQVIYATLTSEGYSDVEKWLKLCLTGSLTTYQYGPGSDCDISLFVDAKIFPEWSRAEMIGIMISKLDGKILPGTPYPLQDYVVAQGITPQDVYKKGLRSGYDIDNDVWIVPPQKELAFDVKAKENGFYVYGLEQADKMERLLRYEPQKAVEMWHQLHRRRMADQKRGKGDHAESNIIYKFLAKRGLFENLSKLTGEHIA